MLKQYEHYTEITKELLDSIKIGDMVRINRWKKGFKVRAVSENYFVMTSNSFGKESYSVCEKKHWGTAGMRHNDMTGGKFHVSDDAWLFGWIGWYDFMEDKENGKFMNFDNELATKAYLQSFEDEESSLSERRGMCIKEIYIKRTGK